MKISKFLLFSLLFVVGQFSFHAKADAIKTVGAGANYTTLKAAFDAINSGAISGAIQLQIIDNTAETSTAVLNASGSLASITKGAGGTGYTTTPTVVIDAPPAGGNQATATVAVSGGAITNLTITNPGSGYTSAPTVTITGGSGSGATATATVRDYNSIKVYPTVTGKTITTSGTFSILINFNAANNVTFDGRLHDATGALVGTSKDLTLINTASGSPGLMVFQFLNNASNNTITYCTIKGSNAGTSKGVISLITPLSANSANGSANNTISNNTFTFAGTTRPLCVVYSQGIPASPNTGNKLLDNEFVNCINPNGGPGAVSIAADNTGWTISGNSFYETAAFTPVAGNYAFVWISGGSGHTVKNNFMGGSEAQCGGSPLSKIGNIANVLRAIYISSGVTTGLPTTVENNTIKNISWSNGTSTAEGRIISTEGAHDVIIKGNTISNVSLTNSAVGSLVSGIYKSNGTAMQDISNNFISGLTSSAASTGQLYGIRLAGGLSTVSNNIVSLSTDNTVEIIGVYDSGAAGKTTQMYFNTVQISGTPTIDAEASYCFFCMAANNTRDLRNNIFVNTRSNSGTASGSHYAAFFNYSGNINLTLDNNNYFVSGTGGILGFAGSNKTTLPIITDRDAASVSVNPSFANASGTAAVDFKPAYSSSLNGDNTVTGYSDFGNNARIIPTIGAWEVAAGLGTSLIDNSNEKSTIIIRNESGIIVPLTGESIVELYTNNGLLIEKLKTNGAYTRKLADGMYIIRINGKATKFIK